MNEQELIAAALEVRQRAYAPYSRFNVGAALEVAAGQVFVGCNVENSSYGLSICAERHAIGNMVSAGQTGIRKIVIAASPLATPCGACRQFIVEFGSDIEIVCVDADDIQEIRRWNIVDLIPDYFHLRNADKL